MQRRATVTAAAAVITLTLVTLSRPAAAERSSAQNAVLAMDLTGGGLLVGGFAGDSLIASYTGLGLYFVASPVAHAIAGDGMALDSLGRRLAFPLGGGLAGLLIGFGLEDDDCDGYCGGLSTLTAGIGYVAGSVLASVLDYRAASDLSSGEPEPMMLSVGGGF